MVRLFFCFVLLWPFIAEAVENIKVAILDDRAPYSDFTIWGQGSGALPELLQKLSISQQDQLELKAAISLNHLKDMLLAQEVQVALPPPFSTPPQGVMVSHPLVKQDWALITRKTLLPRISNDKLNLNQKRILLLNHSPASKTIITLWPNVVLEQGFKLNEALSLLNSGAADGLACDANLAVILSNNLYPGILNSEVIPGVSSLQSLWVYPENKALLEEINRSIDSLSPTVTSSIMTRWLLYSALSDLLPGNESSNKIQDSLSTIGCILLLFCIAYIFSQTMKRQRAERQQKDTLIYWQTLLNSTPTPLLVCDPAGKITHCNHSLQKLLQQEKKSIVGTTVDKMMQQNPLYPPLTHREWLSVINSNTSDFSDRTIYINTQKYDIALWITAYRDSDAIPQGLLIGWFDISERKRLKQELEILSKNAINASREKSEFLARMSHEIRSPMNAILGVLEIEKKKMAISDNSPLQVAYKASRHLLKIIGDVLDLSKIESGEQQLHFDNIEIITFLEQIHDTYNTLAEQKGLFLESNLDPSLGDNYFMDETKINQVLNNLLSNAIKYTEQGIIRFTVTKEQTSNRRDRLTFSVYDSGPGIAENMQQKILKPYVQLNPSTPNSSGLGLSICVQLIKLMESSLHINSTLGKGSCFSFSLTLDKAIKPEKQADNYLVPLHKHSRNILVVDDQRANLIVMRQQLEMLGHRVTTCDNAKQALQYLDEEPFDILFTDCQMPIMNGYQLTKQVRQGEKEKKEIIVIIGTTANAFSDEQKRCLESGMDDVLIKPISLKNMNDILSKYHNIALDLREIIAMSINQPSIIITLIEELCRSAEEEHHRLQNAVKEDSEFYMSLLHRQTGNFALAGFQAGIDMCNKIERRLTHENEISEPPFLYLQLNALTRRFISLLSAELTKLK